MIDTIVSALNAVDINATSSSHADTSRVDSAPVVTQLADQATDSHTYPLHLPSDSNAPYPNAVYALASQQAIEVDGWKVGRVDTYVVSIRDNEFDPLREASDVFVNAVSTHSGSVGAEITDAATDYEFEQRQYRAHFELQITSIATEDNVLPAAFVHPVDVRAMENELATLSIRQTLFEHIAVVTVANQSEIDMLRKQVVINALLGLELPDSYGPLEYVSGSQLTVVGSQVYWRDVWRYQRVIRSS